MKRWRWALTVGLVVLATALAVGAIRNRSTVIVGELAQLTPALSRGFARIGFPLPSASAWTLLITGDVIPARVVNQKMVAKRDFSWPLKNITAVLRDADLTLVNLEAPLLANCPVISEGMKFCGGARFAQALADGGADVANLANNHTLNYGWEGVRETEENLWEAGIESTGYTFGLLERVLPLASPNATRHAWTPAVVAPRLASPAQQNNNIAMKQCINDISCSKFTVKEVKGISLGFLGFNAVGQRVDRKTAEQQIRQADTQVNILIVSVHWGREYVREPQADPGIAPDDPQELGRLFVDWGADVVVGNHPHWYQGIEWYREKPIFYALGNTIFDQEWSAETKVGYLARIHFTGAETDRDKLDIFPLGIRNYGEAYVLEGKESEAVREFLNIP